MYTTISPGRLVGGPTKTDNEAARVASKTSVPYSAGDKPKQKGFKDFEDFYKHAEQAQLNLEKFLVAPATKFAVTLTAPPIPEGQDAKAGIKSKPRAVAKYKEDLGGDYTQLTDICRATLVTKTEDGCNIQKLIDVYGDIKSKVVYTRNKFATPSESGYMDMNLLVNIETVAEGAKGADTAPKMLCEVQLHLRPVQDLKEAGLTHKAYEGEQNANRSAGDTAAEKALKAIRKELARCIGINEYNRVWNQCFGIPVPGGKTCLDGYK